jgi:peptidoglycan/LPS O-acetylase OafA/YrhL
MTATAPVEERTCGERYQPAAPAELSNLDLLRAVAVGLVLFGHLLGCMKIRGSGDLGHFGVLLFFVHTALVLMRSMERLGMLGFRLYSVFLIRRFFRIYPLSILGVLVVVAFRVPAAPWLHGYSWLGWGAFLSNLGLTQNLTHSPSVNCVLWSLPFEIQMYLLLPAIFLWAAGRQSLRAAGGAWLLAVVIAVGEFLVRSGNADPEFLLARYAPCFMAGIFAWQLMKVRKPVLSGAVWALFLLAMVVAYRGVDLLRVYGPGSFHFASLAPRDDHRLWWPARLDLVKDWLFCLIVGAAIPLFREIRATWLRSASKTVARYSYGIYVCHIPILWLCFFRWDTLVRPVAFALALALTGVVSVAVFHWVEDPAIRLGKRLAVRAWEHPRLGAMGMRGSGRLGARA